MARLLVTGGAGFIGSHLCERLLAEGNDVICIDNFLTGSPDNIAPLLANPRFLFIQQDVTNFIYVKGPVDAILHFASPASPIDYLELPIPTLKVGSLGTHKALGLAKEKGARFLLGVHLRGLRRSARAPADRGLLGQRQPDRPARSLRRGEALRRSHHHGLPPRPRRRHAHRPHLQHLRAAHAPQGRPRGAELHRAGAARRGPHGLRRRQPDAELLLRERSRGGHFAPPAQRLRAARQPRQSARDDGAAVREAHHRADQEPAAASPTASCRSTIRRCGSRTSRARGSCSAAGSRWWRSKRACSARSSSSAALRANVRRQGGT